ncbi:lipopolysaccharide biosynthesis protein [Marinivivus vitaminiproducens]|uniref:lipopolysaccharide biosynthesis protein n=1 Tax=Marinivivus vitaminiproducens TaxID=3035935 RepID=UPI002799BC82|nr:hypothetical protein P4R82_10055 [Geminicoccaceae bacterium SCSIO 64248]
MSSEAAAMAPRSGRRIGGRLHQARRYTTILLARGTGTGLQFLAQVLVGQVLGAAALGALSLTQSWTSLLGTLGSLGSPAFVLRRTAIQPGIAQRPNRLSWLQFGWITALIGGTLTALGFVGLASLFPAVMDAATPLTLIIIIALGGFCFSFSRIYMEEQKGRGLVQRSMLMEFSAPFAAIMVIVPVASVLPSPYEILAVASAYILAFALAAVLFTRRVWQLPLKVMSPSAWRRRAQRTWTELAALLGVDIGNQVTTALPLLLLAALGGLKEAAIFGVATRLIGLTATISSTLTGHYAQQVIGAYRARNSRAIRSLYTQSLAANALISACVLLPMIFLPYYCLLPFGAEIATALAIQVLIVMASLRLARQCLGLSQLFLMASGKNHYDVLSLAVSITVMGVVILAAPHTDALTMAIAAGSATLVRGALSWLAVMLVANPIRLRLG